MQVWNTWLLFFFNYYNNPSVWSIVLPHQTKQWTDICGEKRLNVDWCWKAPNTLLQKLFVKTSTDFIKFTFSKVTCKETTLQRSLNFGFSLMSKESNKSAEFFAITIQQRSLHKQFWADQGNARTNDKHLWNNETTKLKKFRPQMSSDGKRENFPMHVHATSAFSLQWLCFFSEETAVHGAVISNRHSFRTIHVYSVFREICKQHCSFQ